jgi:hypothetical protein
MMGPCTSEMRNKKADTCAYDSGLRGRVCISMQKASKLTLVRRHETEIWDKQVFVVEVRSERRANDEITLCMMIIIYWTPDTALR